MASKKKQSEGIALLSMYNDDGEDDMEDAEDIGMRHDQNEEATAGGFTSEVNLTTSDANRMAGVDLSNEAAADEVSTPAEKRRFGTPMPQPQWINTNMVVSPPQDQRGAGRGKLNIVDYGHDEVAMSPEPEEGEIGGSDQLNVTNGDLLDRTPSGAVQVMTPSNQANTPQLSEQLKSDTMNDDAMIRPDDAEPAEADQDEQKSEDPLDIFLPPPPKGKCSEELQRKINKFLEYKKAGKSFNAEVRNRKNYRNPDFLLHAVRYQEIDQIGSCFRKDVFDPHGYDSSDFYDEIEADMRRESERKEQEKKKAQKVEFIAGGTQPGIIAAGAPRINLPVAGGSGAAASGLHLVPPTADSITWDGRQNKKSKWDK